MSTLESGLFTQVCGVTASLIMAILVFAAWGCPSSPGSLEGEATPSDDTAPLQADHRDTSRPSFALTGGVDTAASSNDLSVSGHIQGGELVVDLAWSGSWRSDQNWDAAWIFARVQDGATWKPLILRPEPTSSTVREGPVPKVQVAEDGMGAWIYRSTAAPTTSNDWQVRIQYDEALHSAGEKTPLRTYGIEMVHVPSGPFYAGDGVSKGRLGSPEGASAQVTRKGTLLHSNEERSKYTGGVLESSGVFVYGGDGIRVENGKGFRNEAFPTGFESFYIMKYELTQGQYAEFLNTLTPKQAQARNLARVAGYSEYRGTIRYENSRFAATRPRRACNYLNWTDAAAFADWAGLRPMTELEFEKAARGDQSPVPGEFAWGTREIEKARILVDEHGELATEENGEERVRSGNASFAVVGYVGGDSGEGPLRTGIFAESSDGSRVQSGASYYGVMDMSGNVMEHAITLGNQRGRSYEGRHGDGQISAEGRADVPTWPTELGMGYRGGNFGYESYYLQVSDRTLATYHLTDRTSGYGIGGRFVRSARP